MSTDMMPWWTEDALVTEARQHGDTEICGFILESWDILHISNVADAGEFEMCESEQLAAYRKYGKALIGVFHSHPRGRPSPSNADIEHAPQNMRYWIVTSEEVVEWDMNNDVPSRIA